SDAQKWVPWLGGFLQPQCIMNLYQPPTAGFNVEGNIQGQYRGVPGSSQPHLNTPHLIVHQAGAMTNLCLMLFGPPAPPNIPTLRLGLDRVGAATVQQVQRYAGRGASDVNRLCQCTHRKLLLIAERTPCSFRVLSLEITTDTISTGCCWALAATIMGP